MPADWTVPNHNICTGESRFHHERTNQTDGSSFAHLHNGVAPARREGGGGARPHRFQSPGPGGAACLHNICTGTRTTTSRTAPTPKRSVERLKRRHRMPSRLLVVSGRGARGYLTDASVLMGLACPRTCATLITIGWRGCAQHECDAPREWYKNSESGSQPHSFWRLPAKCSPYQLCIWHPEHRHSLS